jgi:hypothetical protein
VAFEDGTLSMTGADSERAQLAGMAFRALWNVAEEAANDAEPVGLRIAGA